MTDLSTNILTDPAYTNNPCQVIFHLYDEAGNPLAKSTISALSWTLSRERDVIVDALEDQVFDIGDLTDGANGEAVAAIAIAGSHNYIDDDSADDEWRNVTIKVTFDSAVFGNGAMMALFKRYRLILTPTANVKP